MSEKTKSIIQIILVIVLMIGTLIFKSIPEYKKSLGSSDTFINTDNYTDIIEFKINNSPNFAIIISNNIISNILFFDETSLCLYNQNIEQTSLKSGIDKIITLLTANNYLKENSYITLIKYQGTSYEETKTYILNILSPTIIIEEQTSSISKKALELEVTGTDDKERLKGIELFSKNITRDYKNKNNIINNQNITEEEALTYSNTIYNKLVAFIEDSNVIDQPKETPLLEITKIPADSSGTIFADETSWYYVKNKEIYAYISIEQGDESYSYCYLGSGDKYKKGQC